MKTDEPYTDYGRQHERNPYLLDRPEIVIGLWERFTVIVAEAYLRLVLGVVTAIVVFFMMVHDYAEEAGTLGRFPEEESDLRWRLYPFLAGAAVALFPQTFYWLIGGRLGSRM